MPQTAENQQERLDGLLQHALLLDLEVSHQGKIFKIGAVLGNATLPRSGQSSATLHELSVMGQSANCVLGHNLVSHDLTILRETAANHPLLKLPVIDTLLLSPIAFPENPYHRLIKDYKLVRESVNDPVADARQAAMVFQDEFRSLSGLRQTEPRLFELLHFLLATPDETTPSISKGMELFFGALGGKFPDTGLFKQFAMGPWHELRRHMLLFAGHVMPANGKEVSPRRDPGAEIEKRCDQWIVLFLMAVDEGEVLMPPPKDLRKWLYARALMALSLIDYEIRTQEKREEPDMKNNFKSEIGSRLVIFWQEMGKQRWLETDPDKSSTAE